MPVFGNGPVTTTQGNAQEFIDFCAPGWGLAQGSSQPENGVLERPYPYYFHGPDGVWNVHIDAKEFAPLRSESSPGEVNLESFSTGISLATLTLFSPKNKDFHSRIHLEKLSIMGGAFHEPGNETLYAETNFAFDPVAADSYFEKPCQETLVSPLDVTRKVAWDLDIVKSIPVTDAQSWWMKNTILAWFENYNHEREDILCLHDPLAVWLMFHPEDATWHKSGVRIILDEEQRGRSVFDDSRPPCWIAMELHDPERITNDIWNTLF